MTLRRVIAIASLNWLSMVNGFIYGHTACIVTALQNKEEGIDFEEGQISLIASMLTIANFIGFALAALATDRFGRRWPFSLFSITMIIHWITLYFAKHMYQFVIARVISGTSVGALVSLTIFVTPEYTTPNSRAFYLNMVTTVAPSIGATIAHVVGTTMNWRQISLLGIPPAILGAMIPFCWVESPHWLATKGRFEECAKCFRKLNGHSPKSEKELQLLIKMETKKLQISAEDEKPTMVRLLKILKRKYFWESIILGVLIQFYLVASGKLLFTVLASVMLEQIFGTSDVVLFTSLVDGFLIVGACLSCFFITKTSLLNLLYTTGFSANILLVLMSALFYFKNDQIYFDWIIVALLAFYFIIINTGPYPLMEALFGEIFPLELKLYMFSISSFVLVSGFSLSIFLFPYMISAIGYHGLFLVNSAIMTFSLVCIWFRMPETKGKTLQQIEVYFKAKTFNVEEVLNEHTKALI